MEGMVLRIVEVAVSAARPPFSPAGSHLWPSMAEVEKHVRAASHFDDTIVEAASRVDEQSSGCILNRCRATRPALLRNIVMDATKTQLAFFICCSVYTLSLFVMNVGFQTFLGVVNSRRAEGGLPLCAGIEAENSQRVDKFCFRAEGAFNCFSVPS